MRTDFFGPVFHRRVLRGDPASIQFPGCWRPRSQSVGDVQGWLTLLRELAEREARSRRRRRWWRRVVPIRGRR